MPKGYTAFRASQNSEKPEPIWQVRIGRNATEQDEVEARAKWDGKVFTVDGGRQYRVVKVYRNEINHLIVTGKFVEGEKV